MSGYLQTVVGLNRQYLCLSLGLGLSLDNNYRWDHFLGFC